MPSPEASPVLLSTWMGQSPPLGLPAAKVCFSQPKGLLKKWWTKHGISEMNKGGGVRKGDKAVTVRLTAKQFPEANALKPQGKPMVLVLPPFSSSLIYKTYWCNGCRPRKNIGQQSCHP